eukprot:TRINITY_DN19010_c1_g1_i1.p1 TRINITY_DN19010_c1_g1~~TRINITY_DN19010_c1_g1_i1.p1  ORF type:complete len:338 (+),score=106.95 TRINITY_DN19010_c1_g1_i1:69-1082(+)
MPRFQPPDEKARLMALADRGRAAPDYPFQHYLPWLRDASQSGVFEPVGRPRRGEWLDEHEEPGQPLSRFLVNVSYCHPHATFDTVVFVPLADGITQHIPELKRWVEAYYGLNVAVLSPISWDEITKEGKVASRSHSDYGRQLLSSDAFRFAQKRAAAARHLSRRTLCVVALTMEDMYPREGWNFCYGQACAQDAAAIVSLCRYAEPGSPSIMHRACKVLAHELGHVFGLKHCIYHQCLMRGSNHMDELDANGMFLCPVCLSKLLNRFRWCMSDRMRTIAVACAELGVGERDAERARQLAESFTKFEKEHGEWQPKPVARRATAAAAARRTSSGAAWR